MEKFYIKQGETLNYSHLLVDDQDNPISLTTDINSITIVISHAGEPVFRYKNPSTPPLRTIAIGGVDGNAIYFWLTRDQTANAATGLYYVSVLLEIDDGLAPNSTVTKEYAMPTIVISEGQTKDEII